ncbi:hypothetical protein VUR80DRAFT_2479 [Thermomyces stellatus]
MATRRRPFAYDSDNSLPEALDEEEQDTLIEDLTSRNAAQNATYTKLLSALPLLASGPYVLNLVPASPLQRVLSLSCLFVTAYLAYTLPPEETGLAFLDERRTRSRDERRNPFDLGSSPAQKYLPYLNLGLATVILLLSLVRGGGAFAILQGCLPALVYGVVVAAKGVMAGVDPSELRRLKYDYKGA